MRPQTILLRLDRPIGHEPVFGARDTRTRGYFELGGGGSLEQSMLVGVDYRTYDGFSEFGFASAPSIDLFDPVEAREGIHAIVSATLAAALITFAARERRNAGFGPKLNKSPTSRSLARR